MRPCNASRYEIVSGDARPSVTAGVTVEGMTHSPQLSKALKLYEELGTDQRAAFLRWLNDHGSLEAPVIWEMRAEWFGAAPAGTSPVTESGRPPVTPAVTGPVTSGRGACQGCGGDVWAQLLMGPDHRVRLLCRGCQGSPLRRSAPVTPPGARVCACGCGQPVTSPRPEAKYATGACRVRSLRRRQEPSS